MFHCCSLTFCVEVHFWCTAKQGHGNIGWSACPTPWPRETWNCYIFWDIALNLAISLSGVFSTRLRSSNSKHKEKVKTPNESGGLLTFPLASLSGQNFHLCTGDIEIYQRNCHEICWTHSCCPEGEPHPFWTVNALLPAPPLGQPVNLLRKTFYNLRVKLIRDMGPFAGQIRQMDSRSPIHAHTHKHTCNQINTIIKMLTCALFLMGISISS